MATTTANSVADVMTELESLGSEQTRKTYARHGGTGPMFGVLFAELYKIQKRIKKDHELALGLWATGNADARILATLIADPALADETVRSWIEDADNYGLTGTVATYAAKSQDALKIAERWMDDDSEWKGQLAWHVLGAQTANLSIDPSYFEPLIDKIEREIHGRKNRVRYAMVGTLIGIGSINEDLKAKALAAAKRIGHVEVDHGDTACKTPDPLTMIEKAFAHRHRKK